MSEGKKKSAMSQGPENDTIQFLGEENAAATLAAPAGSVQVLPIATAAAATLAAPAGSVQVLPFGTATAGPALISNASSPGSLLQNGGHGNAFPGPFLDLPGIPWPTVIRNREEQNVQLVAWLTQENPELDFIQFCVLANLLTGRLIPIQTEVGPALHPRTLRLMKHKWVMPRLLKIMKQPTQLGHEIRECRIPHRAMRIATKQSSFDARWGTHWT